MSKRVLFTLYALLLALPLCVSAGEAPAMPEITVAFIISGNGVPPDLSTVQDAINASVADRIGAKVKLLPINIGAWNQQINLMLASGEKLDLMVDGSLNIFNYTVQVAKNQLLPLDDLVAKYGAGITASMDPEYLAAGKVGGKLYMVPTVRDFGGNYSLCMRKDIVDKLKIDVSKIKTLDDVDKVLRAVKQKYPDIVPLIGQTAGTSLLEGYQTWDRLGNYTGALVNFGKDLKVTNLYGTKDYAALLKRFRSWYQDGLILKDIATNKDDWSVYVKADRAFAFLAHTKPGWDAQATVQASRTMVSAELVAPFTTTDDVLDFGWTIPRNSTAPDKAMEFLNLLYSDPAVYNLIVFGIEGKHYVKLPNGLVDFPAGVNANTVTYSFAFMGFEFGNQLQGYVFNGNPPTIWKDMADFNRRALKSRALGFIFDPMPVTNEIVACQNVLNRYRVGLETGTLDPAKTLPEFLAKLKEAGIDKIIAEKQKQLDAWAKARS
jgi:putative aldouronate transport system substrate-binding protein